MSYTPKFVSNYLVSGALGYEIDYRGSLTRSLAVLEFMTPLRGVVLNSYPPGANPRFREATCDVLTYTGSAGARLALLSGIPVAVDYAGVHTGRRHMLRGSSRRLRRADVPDTGAFSIARIRPDELDGDHVLIEFIDGDPCRPIIKGTVAHPKTDFGQEFLSPASRFDLLPHGESTASSLVDVFYGGAWGMRNGDFIVDVTRAHNAQLVASGAQPRLYDEEGHGLSPPVGPDGGNVEFRFRAYQNAGASPQKFIRGFKAFPAVTDTNNTVWTISVGSTAENTTYFVLFGGGARLEWSSGATVPSVQEIIDGLANSASIPGFSVGSTGTELIINRSNGDTARFNLYVSPRLIATYTSTGAIAIPGVPRTTYYTEGFYGFDYNIGYNEDDDTVSYSRVYLSYGDPETQRLAFMLGVTDDIDDAAFVHRGSLDMHVRARDVLLRAEKVMLGHDEEGNAHQPVILGNSYTNATTGIIEKLKETTLKLSSAVESITSYLSALQAALTNVPLTAPVASAITTPFSFLADALAQVIEAQAALTTQLTTYKNDQVPNALSQDVTTR